jgi:hypothetical protein
MTRTLSAALGSAKRTVNGDACGGTTLYTHGPLDIGYTAASGHGRSATVTLEAANRSPLVVACSSMRKPVSQGLEPSTNEMRIVSPTAACAGTLIEEIETR